MSVVWIVALFFVAAALEAALFARFSMRKLKYRRAFDHDGVQEGEAVELLEVIRNEKWLPVPWLRVEARMSQHLSFGDVDLEREIASDQYHKSVFLLTPYSQVTRRHRVVCKKRGRYEFQTATLTAGDLLGLGIKSRQLECPCGLTVYPRLLRDDELDAPSTRWQGELAVKRWIMPDPFLVQGIRDYQTGDSARDIHWRQTARTGRMMVKVRDFTVDPRALVVLNVQTSENQWGELNEQEQEAIEEGIRIAASLSMRALDAGVETGFATNGCLFGESGQSRPVIIPPRRDAAQRELLLETMGRLLIHREWNFATFLNDLGSVTGQDILILSAYQSDALSKCAESLRAQGNSVSFIRLKGGREDG